MMHMFICLHQEYSPVRQQFAAYGLESWVLTMKLHLHLLRSQVAILVTATQKPGWSWKAEIYACAYIA